MESALTVATQPASANERRVALALIATLAALTVAALVGANGSTIVVPPFVAIYAGSTGMADALGAALLFASYRSEGRREMLFAACAYVLNTLLIVPYVLTFPGIFAIDNAFANEQSAAFIWLCWHATYALAFLIGFGRVRLEARFEPALALRFVAGTIVVAIGVSTLATAGRESWPILVRDGRFLPIFQSAALGLSLCSLGAAALVARAGTFSPLRLWLAVGLVASALDTGLNAVSPARFSPAWYVGKAEQFVTASVVLFSMIGAWSASQARARSLSDRLELAFEQRRELQDDFEREHRASKAFQDAALPSTMPTVPGLRFAAVYHPASGEVTVGGDWYDAFRIDDGRVVLSVGDVMGNGLDAAVTMNAVRQSIRGAAQLFPDPVAILDASDRALRSERPDSIVTAFVAVFDPMTRYLAYASAGHPPAILRLADGTVTTLEGSGLPLGIRSMLHGAHEETIMRELPDRSMLVLYTDGLTEVHRDVVAGEAQLCAFLRGDGIAALANPASAIAKALIDHAYDDVAIVTVLVDGSLRASSDEERGDGARWSFPSDDGTRARAVSAEVGRELASRGASDDDLALTALLFSELVGNVFRHAGGDADVILDTGARRPVLHVLDRGPGFSFVSRLPASALSESGRGLFVVSALTADFSVVARAGGGSHARAVLPFAIGR